MFYIKIMGLVFVVMATPDLLLTQIEAKLIKTIEVEEKENQLIQAGISNVDFNSKNTLFVLSSINGQKAINVYDTSGKIVKSIFIDDSFTEKHIKRIESLTSKKSIPKLQFLDSTKIKLNDTNDVYTNSIFYNFFDYNDNLISSICCQFYSNYVNKSNELRSIKNKVIGLCRYNLNKNEISTNIFYNQFYNKNKTYVQYSHHYQIDSMFLMNVSTDRFNFSIPDSLRYSIALFDSNGNWIKPIYNLPNCYSKSKIISWLPSNPYYFRMGLNKYVSYPYSYKIYNMEKNETINLSFIDENSNKFLDSLVNQILNFQDYSKEIYNHLTTQVYDVNSLNDSLFIVTCGGFKIDKSQKIKNDFIYVIDKNANINFKFDLSPYEGLRFSKFVKNIDSYVICYVKNEKWYIDILKIKC